MTGFGPDPPPPQGECGKGRRLFEKNQQFFGVFLVENEKKIVNFWGNFGGWASLEVKNMGK